MSIQNKPDYKVFASDAKSGEIETFPDILRGWGVTIDRTGEIPPMGWFNAIGKRTDEWLLYLTQRGIPEWDSSLDYPKSAVVTHGDVIYISLRESKDEQPNTTQAAWSTLVGFLGIDGKLDKNVVVQSTGQSTTNVMSQKAVTDLVAASSYPVGAPIPWPQSTPPSGYLACNGQPFDKTTYPLLAKAYPSGVLPDLRGEFLRGLDAGRGVDAGRVVNSSQGDAIRNIFGRFKDAHAGAIVDADGCLKWNKMGDRASGSSGMNWSYGFLDIDVSVIVPTAPENRPRNIAFLYIVRAA